MRVASIAFICLAVFGLSGCVEEQQKPPVVASAPSPDLAGAVSFVAGDLAGQLRGARPRSIAIDPMLDRASGQQTQASLRIQLLLTPALRAKLNGVPVEAMGDRTSETGSFVATGTLGAGQGQGQYVVRVAVTDPASGVVVAQSAARFQESGLKVEPTSFYTDSPSLVRDRSVEGYVKTSETQPGTLADPLYVEQLETSQLLAAGLDAYNAGRWEDALGAYTKAASAEGGQTLRTFNGLYLSNMRLGRAAAAEDAFGKIVTLGLATNNLAVKLLFTPGTTDFLPDRSFSGAYPMWIRQIARTASASRVCLRVTGHTSASGSDQTNARLSLARATTVRNLLDQAAPGLQRRTSVSGAGSSQNLVGTGADDASDAVDRRVEFAALPCQP